MTYEPLNRRLAILATVFAFLSVVLGVISLATNYWTLRPALETYSNGTMGVGERQHGYMWNVCIVFLIEHFTNFLQ